MSDVPSSDHPETNPGGSLRTREDLHNKFQTGLRPVQEDFFDIFETLLSREGEDGILSNYSFFDAKKANQDGGVVSPLIIAPDFEQDRFEVDQDDDKPAEEKEAKLEKIPFVIQTDMGVEPTGGTRAFVQRFSDGESSQNCLDLFAVEDSDGGINWEFLQTYGDDLKSALTLSGSDGGGVVQIGSLDNPTSLDITSGSSALNIYGSGDYPYASFYSSSKDNGCLGKFGFLKDGYNEFTISSEVSGGILTHKTKKNNGGELKDSACISLHGDSNYIHLSSNTTSFDTNSFHISGSIGIGTTDYSGGKLTVKGSGAFLDVLKAQRFYSSGTGNLYVLGTGPSDYNWSIYRSAESSDPITSKAAPTGARDITPEGVNGITGDALRLRFGSAETEGLIFENDGDTALFSMLGSTGDACFQGDVSIGDALNPANFTVFGSGSRPGGSIEIHGGANALQINSQGGDGSANAYLSFFDDQGTAELGHLGFYGENVLSLRNAQDTGGIKLTTRQKYEVAKDEGDDSSPEYAYKDWNALSINGDTGDVQVASSLYVGYPGELSSNVLSHHLSINGSAYFDRGLSIGSNGADITGKCTIQAPDNSQGEEVLKVKGDSIMTNALTVGSENLPANGYSLDVTGKAKVSSGLDALNNSSIQGNDKILELRNKNKDRPSYSYLAFTNYGTNPLNSSLRNGSWMGFNGKSTFEFENQIGGYFSFLNNVSIKESVCIGKDSSSPKETLDVEGAGIFSGSLYVNDGITASDGSQGPYFYSSPITDGNNYGLDYSPLKNAPNNSYCFVFSQTNTDNSISLKLHYRIRDTIYAWNVPSSHSLKV